MSDERWWIEAQGRAWGPYAVERLPGFRDEGRLGPASRVASTPDGPFAAAGDTPALADLFVPASDPRASTRRADAAAAEPSDAYAAATASRTLLVVTDAPEGELAPFEAALAGHGETLRVRSGLWLVRAREGAGPLRNALSRRLRGPAMLLVTEAPLAAAAWFNLDGETDRALRRLWAG